MEPEISQQEKESVSKIEQIFLKGLLVIFAVAILAIIIIIVVRGLSFQNTSAHTTVVSPLSQETPAPTQ